ncbi:2-amino-4-hydroxy-6-hydroxymethyldihydropteridine diphosphokinase [Endozoicomonadaceae bacterium StTr2]
MKYRYSLGLGSNASPKQNMTAMINALRQRFGRIYLSRICWTSPVGDFPASASSSHYLNAVVQFESELKPAELKRWTKETERQLGRFPGRSDITADIDMLQIEADDGLLYADELDCDPWFEPLLNELQSKVDGQKFVAETESLLLEDNCSVGIEPVWL